MSCVFFDGHNDMLFQMLRRHDRKGALFQNDEGTDLNINLHKACQGNFAGGFFALFAASPKGLTATETVSASTAYEQVGQMLDIAQHIAQSASQKFTIVTDFSQLGAELHSSKIAAILHLEGAEAVGENLENLEELYRRGIRSIGPLWSRPNAFGTGVNFRFPASPDQGAGLTDAGKALVMACDKLGIMLDTSHLNEKGFWDIAALSSRPLVATHSNAHHLCASPRNLTDQQLDAIAEQGGIVGACFAAAYLRKDGRKDPHTELDILLHHLDYLVSKCGEEHVALGSDFDGAVLIEGLRDCSVLPNLYEAMKKYGFGEKLTQGICAQNWVDFLATHFSKS